MTIGEVQIAFDCADPAALAAFWCEALAGAMDAGLIVMHDPEGNAFCLD